MMLSAHFSLGELTVTSTGADNSPTSIHMERLRKVAAFLEEVRHLCGDAPIKVNSAYRSPEVNKAVGGVPTSAHCLAWAADVKHSQLSPKSFAKKIAASSLKFDQLILETSRNVVHLSIDPRMRRQVLTQPKGPGSPFLAGLPK